MYGTVTQIQITPDQLTELVRVAVRSELANYTPQALIGAERPNLLTCKQAADHHVQTPPNIQEGTITIASIQQSNGLYKPRPVLLLRQMPGYGDYLVCGISTQLRQAIRGFDEVLTPTADNQLRAVSVVRLSNLTALPVSDIDRVIGLIPASLHAILLKRLANYLITT